MLIPLFSFYECLKLRKMSIFLGWGRTGLGKEKQNSKPNSSVSVKGKKALAPAKAIQDNSSGTTRVAKGKVNPLTHHAKD